MIGEKSNLILISTKILSSKKTEVEILTDSVDNTVSFKF